MGEIGRREMLAGMAALGLSSLAGGALAFERAGERRIMVFSGRDAVPVLDPHSRYDWVTRMVQQGLYDALAKYVNNPPQIVPWLAERWETSADAKTWTFHLIANARFHNGDPVDAEAVRFSFERGLRLNKGVAWMLNTYLDPEGITAVDPRTVRFSLKQPFPAFITYIPLWFIVNPRQVMANQVGSDLGEAWLTSNDAGSGPFKLRRFEPQAVLQLDAVEDYWKGWPMAAADRPAGFIYRVIREPAPRRAALLRAEVDMVTNQTPDDYDQLAQTRGVLAPNETGATTFAITMNTTKGPTADINVRKAVAHAFDYDALIAIHNGAAALMTSPFPDAMPGYIAVPGMPRRDLAKAREYLSRTQWANGGFALEYVHIQGLEDARRIGLALLASLQPLNITVNIVAQPWPTMIARGARPDTAPDMVSVYVTPVSTDPDAVAAKYHPRAHGQFWGMHHLTDPQLAEMIDAARGELDAQRRLQLYADVQRRVVDAQPEIWGMLANRRWAMRDYVRGFVYCPLRLNGEIDLHTMWIAAR